MTAPAPSGAGAPALPRAGFMLLGLLTLFWGVNWPMMKWGVTEVNPWSFRAICVVLGVAGLFVCARLAGQEWRIAPRDVEAFCGAGGHGFLGAREEAGVFVIEIRRGA